MNQDWWVCSYCYRSNHPLWSKCQTCRAPRLQPADAYGAAQHAGDTAGTAGSGGTSSAEAGHESAARPATKSGAVKPAVVVEPAAAKAAAEAAAATKPGASSKRSRRKGARNGDAPETACPRCGQAMEAEWNHCPRCGSARVRTTAHEIKVVPLSQPSTRPLRRLGMVQPVPDLVESNGNHSSEEADDHAPAE